MKPSGTPPGKVQQTSVKLCLGGWWLLTSAEDHGLVLFHGHFLLLLWVERIARAKVEQTLGSEEIN